MSDKILIIESRFYDDISDKLLEGAQENLEKAGASYEVVTVPGALEIPAALSFAAQSSRDYDAYIVLGCVIRGETSHYDIVCNESARGIYDVTLKYNLALGNGIITVENDDQAQVRADKNYKNKGGGAAEAALRMLELRKQFAV